MRIAQKIVPFIYSRRNNGEETSQKRPVVSVRIKSAQGETKILDNDDRYFTPKQSREIFSNE